MVRLEIGAFGPLVMGRVMRDAWGCFVLRIWRMTTCKAEKLGDRFVTLECVLSSIVFG